MRRTVRIWSGVLLGAALAVAISVPSYAATATWYNADSNSNNNYQEPTSSANLHKRTGQYFELSGLTGSLEGGVHTQVWHGAYTASGWASSQTISGPNAVSGASWRGKFRWQLGGGGGAYTVKTLARATGVSLARVAPQPLSAELSDADTTALTEVAGNYGIDAGDFVLISSDQGNRLLTAESGGNTFLVVVLPESVALGTRIASSELSSRALAISVANARTGLHAQYVITDEAGQAAAARVDGLEELQPGLYADRFAGRREPAEIVRESASGYTILLD